MMQSPLARATIIGALLFILFAFYGTGARAGLWCLVLLAIGLAFQAIMHRISPRRLIAAAEDMETQ